MQRKVKCDGEKTWLKGVRQLCWGGRDTYTDDFMFPSALRVSLDYIGERHSKYFLAGASGAAFDTGWGHETLGSGAGGAIFAHPNHFEAGVKNLFGAIGRNYEFAYQSDPIHMWERIVQSIKSGKPVVASEWQIDHFAVIAGYHSDGKTLLGRRYSHKTEAPKEYVPIALNALSHVIIIGEKTQPSSPYETITSAIEFAIASSRMGTNTKAKGQGGTSHGMIYGPEAYANHAKLIPEKLDPSLETYGWFQHVLFWRLDAMQLARSYAIEYLSSMRKYMSPVEQEHIDAAIQNYRAFLSMIRSDNYPINKEGPLRYSFHDPHLAILFNSGQENEGEPLFWVEGDSTIHIRNKLATQKGRQDLVNLFLKMKELEEKAIAELQLFLNCRTNTPSEQSR